MWAKRLVCAFSTLSLVIVAAFFMAPAGAVSQGHDIVRDGSTPELAAASCYEIKQVNPAAGDGGYWLQTPTMVAPERYFCDQTTDGGGWVMIAKGRDGWQAFHNGQGNPSDMLTRNRAPSDFGTVQLPARTVDALLDGGAVRDLADGVRLVRARNVTGTQWQEVRFAMPQRDRWTWAFGATHPVSQFSWDGSSRSGSGTSNSFGADNSWRRVITDFRPNQGWRGGWAYGTSASGGSTSASSYLYSQTGNSALPYTEVYLRPTLKSGELDYHRIPDDGLAEVTGRDVASSWAARTPWGVTGNLNGRVAEGNSPVQAFAQIGNTIYVGGNFTTAQRGASASGSDVTSRPGLAAFDASTGELVRSFAPVFNNQVKALVVLPNGKLLAGGDFTQVNGQQVVGSVLLDPVTGQRDPSWNLQIENRLTGGVVSVRGLSLAGDYVYFGGAFTHFTGGGTANVYGRHGARVNWQTGAPDRSFNPDFNGTVMAIDTSADDSRYYAAGYFTHSGSNAANKAVALQAVAGAPLVAPWPTVWSNSDRSGYQQAIHEVGDRIYSAGSEHSIFGYDTTTFERKSGSITMGIGGDFQALASGSGVIYGGCHCASWNYQDAYHWPSPQPGWTQADNIMWVGAWDAASGDYIPDFSPQYLGSNDAGSWSLFVGDDGTLWVGGDFTGSSLAPNSFQWNGGFVKFPASDTTPPSQPGNLSASNQTADSVRLSWNAPSGGVGNGGGYQILRDDRVITTVSTTSAVVQLGGENRFFVRAVDAAGNLSASTPVLAVPGGNAAPTPVIATSVDGFTVTFDASGSTDDGSIESYEWEVAGVTSDQAVFTHTFLGGGTYPVTLRLIDDEGAWARTTMDFVLEQPAPTDRYGALVFDADPWAFWRLDESSGPALDRGTGSHHGTYRGGVVQNQSGIRGGVAAVFDGSNDFVSMDQAIVGPQVYSIEAWFRTTTTRGGKIVGFGNQAVTTSSSHDRHVFMQNNGSLVFGAWIGEQSRITSAPGFNDGQWHHVVATQGPEGMRLYLDGVLADSNDNPVAEDFTGHWRIGGDTSWEGSTSGFFAGAIDEVAIYDTVLTPERIAGHHAVGSNAIPTAAFTFDKTYLDAVFDASGATDADGVIVEHHWDLGDGSTAEGVVVNHTYTEAGAYEVTLRVTDDDGDQDSQTHTITVEEPPNQAPVAVMQVDKQYLDVTVDASDSTDADGTITSYTWDFGDGSEPATGVSASHSYELSGDYTVTLTVMDDDGDSATIAQQITVEAPPNQPPTAVFSYDITFLEVAVDGSGSTDADGVVETYSWDFGDGSAAVTGAQATHVYEAAGTYTVTLTVTDNDGDSATTSQALAVAPEPPNQPPTAVFSYTTELLTVIFDASEATDPDGVITTYVWDFGDGSAPAEGAIAAHEFAAAGTYTVTLTVTDDDGEHSMATQDVTVSETPPNQAPSAAFSYEALLLEVNFDATGSVDPDGVIEAFSWDFGDGTTGDGAIISHTYGAAGTYQVTLSVVDDDGDAATVSQEITVVEAPNQPPVALFTLATNYLAVAVDGSGSTDSDGTILSYVWDFGDGTAATGEQASHTYADDGTYTITLSVTDDDGDTSTVSQQVTVAAEVGEPLTRQLFTQESSWAYRYNLIAPASNWAEPGFDASGWAVGQGPIGYGSTVVETDVNPPVPLERPRVTYFLNTIEIEDASRVTELVLAAPPDDGVRILVNGVEVGRKYLDPGPVNHDTFANSARRTTSAQQDMLVVEVPVGLLVDGTNVVAAATHVNYRSTPDMTFWMTGHITETGGTPTPNQAPTASFNYSTAFLDVFFDGSGSTDADGVVTSYAWDFGDGNTGSDPVVSHSYQSAGTYTVTLSVTDDDGDSATATQQVTVEALAGQPVTTQLFSQDSAWSYRYDIAAPSPDWAQPGFDASTWAVGQGPIGYGSALVETDVNPPVPLERPRATYFHNTFEVADASRVSEFVISVPPDDGVIVYINGVEVGRRYLDAGPVTHDTFANSARRTTAAQTDLLVVSVPQHVLVSGINVVAAATHVNYRSTPDMSFWMDAHLTQVE